MRSASHVMSDDDLHASLQCVRDIGSPIAVPPHGDSSSSGVSSNTIPGAGAAAGFFNLDACFKMGEGK